MRDFNRFSFLSAIAIIVFLLTQQVNNVFACSYGPGPTFEEQLLSSSVIVRGQIVESDTAYQNYVLQVDEYLAGGTGAEYLLINNNSPRTIQALIDTNGGSGDCLWFDSPLPELETGYFWLSGPSVFGTYHAVSIYGFVLFPHTFPLNIYDEDYEVERTLNQQQFEEWIVELRNTKPTSPTDDRRYPATAPLLLTTQDGTEYILPVTSNNLVQLEEDSSTLYIPDYYGIDYEPVGCSSWSCVTISSDNRTLIVEVNEEYVYPQNFTSFKFTADKILLSPIGLAVWTNNTLQVYALHDTTRYFSDGDIRLPRFIQEMDVTGLSEHGTWSENGNLLAFSDVNGLWLWNPFQTHSSPQLLVTASTDIPIALHFSGQGRYLAVEDGETRYIIDLITQDRLPFGYVSPDGQLAISCSMVQSTEYENACGLVIQQLAPVSDFPKLIGIVDTEDIRVQWVNSRRILISACDLDKDVCGVYDVDAYSLDWNSNFSNFNIHMGTGEFLFAKSYAIQGRNVAILNDETMLTVNGDVLQFDLESSIIEIRWLPSLFYGEEERFPLRPPIHMNP